MFCSHSVVSFFFISGLSRFIYGNNLCKDTAVMFELNIPTLILIRRRGAGAYTGTCPGGLTLIFFPGRLEYPLCMPLKGS